MSLLPAQSILRYELTIQDTVDIHVPPGAHPLRVQGTSLSADGGYPRIEVWCHVPDTSAPRELRRFRIIGTGGRADVDPGSYVGTAITGEGRSRGVWHVFDAGPVKD